MTDAQVIARLKRCDEMDRLRDEEVERRKQACFEELKRRGLLEPEPFIKGLREWRKEVREVMAVYDVKEV